jgi:hypothetical protein
MHENWLRELDGLSGAAQPPIRITAQVHRGERMLRVPFTIEGKLAEGEATYTLVAKGPRIGRLEFDVTGKFNLSGYGSTGSGRTTGAEGLLTSAKGLALPADEIVEVFVEEKATPQAKAVRVSNIVNLTWELSDSDAQKTTESQQHTLAELHQRLKDIEQQLGSRIPNAVDTLETKVLKQQRAELQRKIFELGPQAPLIERVHQPVAEDPLASHPELVQMRSRLGDLNARISQERLRQEGAKESAYLLALISQSKRQQSAIWELESLLHKEESHEPDGHQAAEAVGDNDVAIRPNANVVPGSTASKEPRTEDLPLHIAHADAVQKEDGVLAVDYEMYGAVPRTVFVRRGEADQEVVIPYFLIVKGPHLGRKELVLPSWPPHEIKAQDYDGTIVAPRNLRINNGEPLEIFIEQGRVPGKDSVRVSNVIKLPWQIKGAPTQDIRYPQGLMKPFTAIHWVNETPQVKINDVWYDLLAVGEMPIEKIIAKAREKRGRGYQQLVESQLPEFLKDLGVVSFDKAFSLSLRRLSDGARETFDVHDHPFRAGQTIVAPREAEATTPDKPQDSAPRGGTP